MVEPSGPGDVGGSILDAKNAFPNCAAGAVEGCPADAKAPASPPVVQCVTQINATTPGTNGVRKASDTRADTS